MEIRWIDVNADQELWSEWQRCGSGQVLSIAESEAARGTVGPDVILPSHIVYRNKNAPLRPDDRPLLVMATARL